VEHFPELRHVPAPALRSAGCLARWQETANARRRQTAYILTVPKSEHETTAWQAAIETLLVAAGVHDAEIEIGRRSGAEGKGK
jgi:hypothetical protein